VADVAGTGVPGVLFNGTGDAYTSTATTVTDLEGNSDRSIEVWAYNPAIATEESLVSWGRRGTTRANVSLNFGNNASYGASTHFNDDLSWGTVPSAGAWHHLTYVYSGATDVRVYVDGVLSKSKTLGGALATTAGNSMNIGAQRSADGTLATPQNWNDAGWYAEGVVPGEPGPAVIVGHRDSAAAGAAVFYRLGDLSPGADVTITERDGSVSHFIVQSMQQVAKADFPTDEVYGPSAHRLLRLITCTGDFDFDAGSYLDNLVVTARAV
jgi:hypothetical protein